ncbi:hypothetical protein KEM52_002035 [Ascosphaera acerosa]|nr:hypothetical protein KEM52_002035 [Ascosphaera acerosa]
MAGWGGQFRRPSTPPTISMATPCPTSSGNAADGADQSLRALFQRALAAQDRLATLADSTGEAYRQAVQAAVADLETCQRRIAQVSVFSSNEGVEDVTTSDLPYLTVDYHLAELLQRVPVSLSSARAGGRAAQTTRQPLLTRVSSLYEAYLSRLDDYGLLSDSDRKLYERYTDSPATFTLAPVTNAAARRETKIARYREEKQLQERLAYYRQHARGADTEGEDDGQAEGGSGGSSTSRPRSKATLQVDDETVRQLYLAEIRLYAHRAFQALDQVGEEMRMLAEMARLEPSTAAGGTPAHQEDDGRRRKPGLDGRYREPSDRLDVGLTQTLRGGGTGGPLLSKTGVPLRTFTLTDRRSELQRGVFRPGHNLPTMSIDEYLEEERRRGNIIEGGGEASGRPREVDEDDEAEADRATYKAREWDEFKEANPRGSGNTLNRG